MLNQNPHEPSEVEMKLRQDMERQGQAAAVEQQQVASGQMASMQAPREHFAGVAASVKTQQKTGPATVPTEVSVYLNLGLS